VIQAHAAMTKARNALMGSVLVSSAGLLIIQWMPKDRHEHGFRLVLTLMFFLCLLTLIGTLTRPLGDYLQARAAWSFDRGGPSLQHAAKLLAHGFGGYVAGFAYCLMGLATLTMLRVLSSWPEFAVLQDYRGALQAAWWIALLTVPGYLLATPSRLAELRHRRQALAEQVMLSGFKPPDAQDLREQQAALTMPAVSVTRPAAFRAGGFEWQWSDFYKNAVVFGQPGSGKTVCVLNALIDGLMASGDTTLPPAGLILDPKGDFRDKIELLCRQHGRAADLLVIDPMQPGQSAIWNPLDSADDELEIAARFAAVIEILEQKTSQDTYFADTARTVLRHAIAFIRATNTDGAPPSFSDVLAVAMLDAKAAAKREEALRPDDRRGQLAHDFLCDSWADLSEKTRSIVQSCLINMIDPFLLPPYDQVFAGRSTVRMSDIIDQGKILYVYMPIADKERMARTISTLAKLEFAREVLKRPDKDRRSFFLCDEFQAFFTAGQGKGDADFFERSRQSNHANVIATQNMPALLKQVKDPHPVDNLLGSCAIKIFLRNTDSTTNEYASRLFGEQLAQTASFSRSGFGFGRGGRGQSGASVNAAYERVVRPEEFIRLAQPDRDAGVTVAETIVHLGSRAAVTREKLAWPVHPIRDRA
jgi:hypothetical protein